MNNERKISPKEFSDKRKSQDDEILKKQLELREREIALKEKELELRMLQAQGSENSVEKERVEIEKEKLALAKRHARGVFILFGLFFGGIGFFLIIFPVLLVILRKIFN